MKKQTLVLLSLLLIASSFLFAEENARRSRLEMVSNFNSVKSVETESSNVFNVDSKVKNVNVAKKTSVDYTTRISSREVLFSQTAVGPDGEWNFGNSDTNSGYYCTDNFSGVQGTITEITFTGLSANNTSGWQAVDEDPMDFEITFYEDNNGQLGSVVSTSNVSASRVETGLVYAGSFPSYNWTCTLTEPVTLESGWVKILGTSVASPLDGWFMWLNSTEGDGTSISNDVADSTDRAFVLNGTVADPAAPAAVSDLSLTPNADGSLNAVIAWTNPSTNYEGSELTDLDEIKIYNNETLVTTISDPTIGGSGSYTVTVDEAGLYSYKVVGVNDLGEGLSTITEVKWIGNDVPAAVTELTLSVEDIWNGVLTWVNPTAGLHDGPYNEPITGYTIVRSDDVTFEVQGEATTYTDVLTENPAFYSYTVTPVNSIGSGASATSNSEWIGDEFTGIVVLDLATDNNCGNSIKTHLENIYSGDVQLFTDISIAPITSDIEALFISLGMYNNGAYKITPEQAPVIVDYINGGGNVYIEGGDTFGYDPGHNGYDFNSLLGITGAEDGSPNDLTTVNGAGPLENMEWAYNGISSFVDKFTGLAENAEVIFRNNTADYNCGIMYQGTNYKTVATSFQISELDDPSVPFNIIMTFFGLGDPVATISGIVTDEATNEPLEGATVSFGERVTTTNSEGAYNFGFVSGGSIDITCSLAWYEDVTLTQTIEVDQNNEINFALTHLPYGTISGTVTDDSNNPIENANVSAGDASAITAADGTYSITPLAPGEYEVSCIASGYNNPDSQTVSVTNGNTVECNFQLEVSIVAPVALSIIDNHNGTADFSWADPTSGTNLSESFEEGFPPENWSQVINNTMKTWSQAETVTLVDEDDNQIHVVPPDGTKQLQLQWDYAHQDEWIISPEMVIPGAAVLSFMTYIHYGSTNGDHYYVKISTDGGETWTVLWDASALPEGDNHYDTPVEIDLSAYAGQSAKIAWQAIDGDGQGLWHVWFIDQVSIGNRSITENGRPANGFNVFLDGIEVASNVTETNYQFTDLSEGDHTAGVQAVYSNGVSETTSIDFVISMEGEAPSNLQVTNENYGEAVMTWDAPSSGTPTGYKVYVNNDLKATVEATTYTVSDLSSGEYTFGVEAVYTSTTSERITVTFTSANLVPSVTKLKGNFPNPFNPVTVIKYDLSEESDVSIVIYNMLGQKVKTLVNEKQSVGPKEAKWDGTSDSNESLSSGVYFYKMQTGRYTSTKKMVLMK